MYWVDGSPSQVTSARGICINAALNDADERRVYAVRHGVEMIESFSNQTRAAMPRAERLTNTARIEAAIEKIIGPLADGLRPN